MTVDSFTPIRPTAVRLRRWLHALMALALVASYIATLTLPASVGWENSWLENIQAMLLLVGALMAVRFARSAAKTGTDRSVVAFAMALVPVWGLMLAREMSWGATFLAPLSFSEDGPVFSSSVLWYKPAVYPLAALALAFSAYVFLRYRADRVVLRLLRSARFAWVEVGFLLVAGLISTYAEGHLGIQVASHLAGHTLVMEEWVEVVAYMALVVGQWHVFGLLRPATPYETAVPLRFK